MSHATNELFELFKALKVVPEIEGFHEVIITPGVHGEDRELAGLFVKGAVPHTYEPLAKTGDNDHWLQITGWGPLLSEWTIKFIEDYTPHDPLNVTNVHITDKHIYATVRTPLG